MEDITWQDFGAFLQQVRRRRGVSQERLAELTDYHRIHIWRLEHGERHPSKQFLRLLADTLTLTPAETKQLAAFRQMILSHCEPDEGEQAEGRKEGLKRGRLQRQHGDWRCKQSSSHLVNPLFGLQR